jgi:hypothetical protein
MLDDALALSLPAPDNLKASVPDSPHSMAMLQDASFSEPENPANPDERDFSQGNEP